MNTTNIRTQSLQPFIILLFLFVFDYDKLQNCKLIKLQIPFICLLLLVSSGLPLVSTACPGHTIAPYNTKLAINRSQNQPPPPPPPKPFPTHRNTHKYSHTLLHPTDPIPQTTLPSSFCYFSECSLAETSPVPGSALPPSLVLLLLDSASLANGRNLASPNPSVSSLWRQLTVTPLWHCSNPSRKITLTAKSTNS